MRRARVIVSGRVQGVGFRWSCRREAERAGVTGWVRNLHDGRVEAAFEGDDAAVEQMLSWCRLGPTGAVVVQVDVEAEEPQGQHGFSIVGGPAI
ncbi:MAG: acylphosphatase [Acidimicrobiales bacterium]